MSLLRKHFEIFKPIIRAVMIDMVNMVPVRDWAISLYPYISVQSMSNTVNFSGCQIKTGFIITIERDSIQGKLLGHYY
jgi:hypothetical protein